MRRQTTRFANTRVAHLDHDRHAIRRGFNKHARSLTPLLGRERWALTRTAQHVESICTLTEDEIDDRRDPLHVHRAVFQHRRKRRSDETTQAELSLLARGWGGCHGKLNAAPTHRHK